MGGKAKGGSFERKMCVELSQWWSGGKRDDIFWRSASSGGRSTQRSKKGKSTFGAAGDITATDPIGQPLLRLITFEMKCGYSTQVLAAMLPRPDRGAARIWDQWLQQARSSSIQADSYSWAIVHQRNRHLPTITMPVKLFDKLPYRVNPTPQARVMIHAKKKNGDLSFHYVVETLLETFLTLDPKEVRALAKELT